MTSDARQGRRALFGLLFLLSGAAGLVYEQLWIRELQHFFGSTIHSITTVVAAYMGGLGLGAWFLGKRADRHHNPALLYGILEIAIGVFGLLSPLVFKGIGAAYLGVAASLSPGLWLATAIKFVFAFAVMLIPTFLMGGTLPILTRAFAGDSTVNLRRELALFYGLNTVGGVIGCALGGYILVERAGVLTSLIGCGLLNLALGAAAIAVSTSAAKEEAPAPVLEPESVREEASPAVQKLAIWLIGLTAFASLLYEIAWTRVLVLVVGSSTYAFTTILVCFLLGIGLGSLIAIGRGRGTRELLLRAAMIQGAIAVLASLLFPFFRALPVYIVATLQIQFLSPTQLIVLQSVALAVVVIPPAIGMGLAFPILAELAARRSATTGTETGRAYFANTIGSIAGAIITGFIFVHLIGAEKTLVLGVAINVIGVALVSWRLHRDGGTLASGERAPALFAFLALVIALFAGGWSSRLLDRGPAIYGRDMTTPTELDHYLRGYGSEQLSYDEGWNSTVSIWRNGGTTWLKNNGKADASSVADMNTQIMVGLLPLLAHPKPARVFVVGFGSGVTARTAADAIGVERVDVVEIERAVVRAAPYFASVNRDVLSDPRVHLIEDDARSALQLAREPYDVIISEPSNPWIAGIAALFTKEYFAVAKSRLAEDGVFAQWVQTYRVPVSVVAVVVANMRTVFPHVEMWFANPADLIILASNRPIQWNGERVAAHMAPGAAMAPVFHDWLEVDQPSHLLGRFITGDSGTARLAATAAFLHNDDRPTLEFVAARGLFASGLPSVFDSIMAIRDLVRDTLPPNLSWTLAPGEWQAAYTRSLPSDNRRVLPYAETARAAMPADPVREGDLGVVRFHRNEFRAALPYLTNALKKRPNDPRYLLRAGIATTAIGDIAGGHALLERARAAGGDSVYAMSLMAETAAGQGDWARAATLLTRALESVHPTIAAPFPGSLQNALRTMALSAPPALAAPVVETAIRTRPSWDLAYLGGVWVHARLGGEHCVRAAELAEEMPRFGWEPKEIVALLRPCAR